ncbi:MAG: peptidylprolyl isomerase [Solirubrobacterales bacterium]
MPGPRSQGAFLAIVAISLVAGCGGDDGEQAALPEGCSEVAEPRPKEVSSERRTEPPGPPARAVVATSCGEFVIELDTERAPKTTASFAGLAEQGFYDGTGFHRVAPGFVIQGGDPLGDGTGGPGYSVDEPPPQGFAYLRGTVAMAKTEAEPPGRSGSQFFIVTAPADAGLPPEFALLGKVVEGFDVLERIESLGTEGEDGPPAAPVVIESVEVEVEG